MRLVRSWGACLDVPLLRPSACTKHWPDCSSTGMQKKMATSLRLAQVAVRLRPLNAREVAQGDTEAVTVSPEDQHALQVIHCPDAKTAMSWLCLFVALLLPVPCQQTKHSLHVSAFVRNMLDWMFARSWTADVMHSSEKMQNSHNPVVLMRRSHLRQTGITA